MLLDAAGFGLDAHLETLVWLESGHTSLSEAERHDYRRELARARILESTAMVARGTAVTAPLAAVETWGPSSIEADPRAQRALSAIWLRAAESMAPGLRLRLGGRELDTLRDGTVTLIGVPRRRPGRPGWFEKAERLTLEIYDPAGHRVQHVGELEVRPEAARASLTPRRAAQALCVVEGWGPEHTSRAAPTYREGDDAQGVWVKSGCFPERLHLVLGTHRIEPAAVEGTLATFRVPNRLFADVERLPLTLVDGANGERLELGNLRISP